MVALMLPINIGDKLLIKHVFGADAVAHYSVAFDINTKAYLLISAVNTAMFAVVLHRFARKRSSFAPLAAGLVTVFLVTVLYYFPLMVLAPVLLTQWINADFSAQAAPLTSVMAFASILYLFGSVFENSLNAMGRTRRVLRVYLMGIIAYVIAVSFAIWQQSLIGFMYSYATLCAVLLLGFFIEYNKVKKQYRL
jgi:O-antigen/teichoic acid export membrane protein